MKKLLHERLRECSRKEHVLELIEFPDDGLWKDFAERFADEIERYYIPRPRFEDGEPVQFDDTAIGESVFWVVKNGVDIEGQNIEENKGKVTGYTFDDGEQPWLRITDDDGDITEVRPPELGDYFKRPFPKVLDADGVEIKVGETLWSTDPDTLESFRVLEIGDDLVNGVWSDGEHDKAVPSKYFTHKEPDSLEKLRDDMAAWNKLKMKTFFDEWIDRISALIERLD